MKLFSIDIHKSRFEDADILANLTEHVKDLMSTHRQNTPDNHNKLQYEKFNQTKTTYVGYNPAVKEPFDSSKYNNLHNTEPFLKVTKYIEEQAKIFWDELEYFEDVSPKIFASWANITDHNEDVSMHAHSKCILSCVLYLSASENAGNIVFEHPMDLLVGSQPIRSNKLRKEIEVQTGDLIIFPSYLKHCALPNLSGRPRIVLTADMNSTGVS
jgi:uncharacterized protein (TIGR02466 family)